MGFLRGCYYYCMLKHHNCIIPFVDFGVEELPLLYYPTQPMFLGTFCWKNKYDYQVRDERQSGLVVNTSVRVSSLLAKKHAVLSFINLRRVSDWWKQTLTKVQRLQQRCSLNVSAMLLLWYIHKMSGDNILAKVPWHGTVVLYKRKEEIHHIRPEYSNSVSTLLL